MVKNNSHGFTIVELLVVIVVIGVLAAITVVSYTGVSNKATVASIQSDLSVAAQKLKMYYTENSSYPTSMSYSGNLFCPTPADTRYCLQASAGNTYAYNSSGPNLFTLILSHSGVSSYQITESSGITVVSFSNSGGGNWSNKALLSITNFQPNFQTLVSVTYRSAMRADFSDLRFADSTTGAELPYWIESYTASASANVWVKTSTNNTTYMYYGNSSATSSSNGSNVFAFFDDFSGSLANWSTNVSGGATVATGSGLITHTSPKATYGVSSMYTTSAISGSYRVRFRKKMNPNASVSYVDVGNTSLATYQMNTNDCVNSEFHTGGYNTGDCGVNTVSPRTDDNVWHNVDITYTPTSATLSIDGAASGILSGSFDSSIKIGAGTDNCPWKGSDGSLQFDYIYARLYAATDPSVSVGSEQSN